MLIKVFASRYGWPTLVFQGWFSVPATIWTSALYRQNYSANLGLYPWSTFNLRGTKVNRNGVQSRAPAINRGRPPSQPASIDGGPDSQHPRHRCSLKSTGKAVSRQKKKSICWFGSACLSRTSNDSTVWITLTLKGSPTTSRVPCESEVCNDYVYVNILTSKCSNLRFNRKGDYLIRLSFAC